MSYRSQIIIGESVAASRYRDGVEAKKGLRMDTPVDPLERLRQICLTLPEATERLSHGEPTWFVQGKRVFVMYADHHHDDRLAFWCAAPAGVQEALVGSEPERFFVPPYVGGRGWLGVWLDVPVDWEDVEGLVADAYRMVAPERLIRQLAGS